jgi:V/A-type H+-transporting ATPase subunit C
MRAELLSQGHWRRLLDATDWADQMRVLEGTHYAAWRAATPEATLRGLGGAVQDVARRIERSIPPRSAGFIRVWRRRELLRNLKTLLKGKALGQPADEIQAELLDVDPAHLLPVEALLRCVNLDAALDRLEATCLRHWIREARRIYARDPTLFGLDAALDRLYYPELWHEMLRLDAADQRAVRPFVEAAIDQVNLLWLLRYRLNYRLSAGETYYLLVPVTGRITAAELKALVREESLEGMAAKIVVQPFRDLLARCQSHWQVEAELARWRARQAARASRHAAFTLGEALAVLVAKEIECRDVVAALEGTRLGVGADAIRAQWASVAALHPGTKGR